MENGYIVIAIDGGAASGKSTVSRQLAKDLNLLHVDTGMHFRAITSELLQKNINISNKESVDAFIKDIEVGTLLNANEAQITINKEVGNIDILRGESVTRSVSEVASIPSVRNTLLQYQRSLILLGENKQFNGIVMEGRDIGSVILPNADYKFFLEASLEVRQRRRDQEGKPDVIKKRDEADSSRNVAPLVCTEGAIRIDSTNLSIQEVFERIKNTVSKKMIKNETF